MVSLGKGVPDLVYIGKTAFGCWCLCEKMISIYLIWAASALSSETEAGDGE